MLLTCYKVTKTNCSQSDNHKVDGLQGCPSLDVFEDNSRNGHKDNAASQDEEDGRDHPDLCLAHLFFLENGQNKGKKKYIIVYYFMNGRRIMLMSSGILISVISELIK